jgi:hypothetical protein
MRRIMRGLKSRYPVEHQDKLWCRRQETWLYPRRLARLRELTSLMSSMRGLEDLLEGREVVLIIEGFSKEALKRQERDLKWSKKFLKIKISSSKSK